LIAPTADGISFWLLALMLQRHISNMIELRQAAAKIGFSENRSASVHLSTCAAEAQEKRRFAAQQSRNSP